MTEETRPTEPTGVPGDGRAPAAPKLTRRRFTKAGVVAPVIMTLASRPVWGENCTESALGSMTHASQAGPDYDPADCIFGCSPTQWLSFEGANEGATWPSLPSLLFDYYFSIPETGACTCLSAVSIDTTTTLLDVLRITPDNGWSQLLKDFVEAAQEGVAAILNIYAVTALAECVSVEGGATTWYPLTESNVTSGFNNALSTACAATDCTSATAFDDFLTLTQNARAGAVCPIPYIDCMGDE